MEPGRVEAVAAVGILVILPLVIALVPLTAPAGPEGIPPGFEPASLGVVAASVKAGPSAGNHAANPFFAVVFTDVGTPRTTLRAVGAYLNQTPVTWIRFGGGGAAYDPTTSTNYVPPPSGTGRYVAQSVQLWDLAWFQSWCYARSPHCSWLTYLPGEENNTAAAVHVAKWFHNVLGFPPTYWEFGNEPTAWTHYGKNLTTWSTSDRSIPTGPAYAVMVRNYISAVRAVFPGDRFVGIEAACACKSSLVSDTAAVDGSNLVGMAYHSYPAQTGSSTILGKFFGLLASTANLSSTVPAFRSSVTSSCRACGSLPIDLGEYQAGPFSAFSPLASGYAGAPFLAVSVLQALEANVSQFAVFDTNTLFDSATGQPTPEGELYAKVLPHLVMGSDRRVAVVAGGTGGLYGLLTQNGTHESLLIVNTNLLTTLNLTVGSSVFPVGSAGSYWTWASGATAPVAHTASKLPGTYSVGPEGILLLST